MYNMEKIIDVMKKAAIDAVNEAVPMSFEYGEVISANPLKIKIDQKLTLSSMQLILTNAVKDHSVMITDGSIRSILIKNGLQIGEKVILIKAQGGQKYVVLERLVE